MTTAVHPRTPVLVGVGCVDQREDDPARAREALDLMGAALEAAAEDAGRHELLSRASSIRVPRGFWQYSDPGRLLAGRIGAKRARTTLAEIGVLQQTLISAACRAIAAGEEDVALVVGGEAKYRELRARIGGAEIRDTPQADTPPDELLAPREPLFHELEAQRGLMMPVRAFALMETALRADEGLSPDAHLDALARLWSDFSAVAARNPHAWKRTAVSFDEIRTPSEKNRPMSFPYSRLHNSDWNVDQASALILCALETAQSCGVAEDRLVFPLGAAESNHVTPLACRPALHRSPGAALAGARAFELAGTGADAIDHLEVYSCFPAPVRVFTRELGLDPARALTVTGGMAFAGGPLNNYVLQATARMAEVLRADPGASGLVTSISGFMNKLGCAIWSTAPPATGFRFADVSDDVASADAPLQLVADATGSARIAGYTVGYAEGAPADAVAVCDLPDGRRAIVATRDPALSAAMTIEEFVGRPVDVHGDADFSVR